MLIRDRRHHCYPYLLQQFLGDQYNVRNYGLNDRNAMESGKHPYRKEKRYQESLRFLPDIVLIKLGSNDSKKGTWIGAEAWEKDYRELLNSYLTLPSHPQLILITPAYPHPVKQKDGSIGLSFQMQDEAMEAESKVIQRLGEELHTKVIDMRSFTKGKPEWFNSDGIHPNNGGARQMAELIYAEFKK